MEFRCEDLASQGLVLIPPSEPAYPALLADIEERMERARADNPPPSRCLGFVAIDAEERATSAILWNQSTKPVSAMTLIWDYQDNNGRQRHSIFTFGVGAFPSLLLPFGMTETMRQRDSYWKVILPGSKRYLGNGSVVGDNSDVLPPTPSQRSGGMGTSLGRGRGLQQSDKVTLILDSAFFADGEFVGANRGKLWEQVVPVAESAIQIGRIALDRSGPEDIFAAIEELLGLPLSSEVAIPPAPAAHAVAYQRYAVSNLANFIASIRRQQGDEQAVRWLASWASSPVPQFRRAPSARHE